MQGYVEDLWTRTRLLRIGFVAGLIVGALAGWFFHGVISLIVRFFFVIILLIPFVVALIAWWRLRRQVNQGREGRDDWDYRPARSPRSSGPPYRSGSRPGEAMDDGAVITVESWELGAPEEQRAARDRSPEE
jgi:hypothetical protein